MKGCARYKSNFAVNRDFEYVGCIQVFGKNAPQEHAALRVSPTHFGGEYLFHHFKHHIAAFLVGGADCFNVFIQKAAFTDFVSDILVEGCGVQISALFGHDQFADHLFGRDHPCQTQTRSQQL